MPRLSSEGLLTAAIKQNRLRTTMSEFKRVRELVDYLPAYFSRDEKKSQHDVFRDGMLQGYLLGLSARRKPTNKNRKPKSAGWGGVLFSDFVSTHVVGLQYQFKTKTAQEKIFRQLTLGTEVTIQRETKNRKDPFACAVYLGRKRIGYLPRQMAEILAPKLDSGDEYAFYIFDFNLHSLGRTDVPTLNLLGIHVRP